MLEKRDKSEIDGEQQQHRVPVDHNYCCRSYCFPHPPPPYTDVSSSSSNAKSSTQLINDLLKTLDGLADKFRYSINTLDSIVSSHKKQSHEVHTHVTNQPSPIIKDNHDSPENESIISYDYEMPLNSDSPTIQDNSLVQNILPTISPS